MITKVLRYLSLVTSFIVFNSIATAQNYDGQITTYSLPLGGFLEANDIVHDATGNIFILDRTLGKVTKFDSNGNTLLKFGKLGSDDGQFNQPEAIAVDSNGNIYVSDYGNNRIQKFTSAGVFITKWGTFGVGDGQFKGTGDLAIDSNNNVYVSDYDSHRIQKFTSDGIFITKWGSFGTGNGQFQYVRGIAIGTNGTVYVADGNNDRIQIFTSAGVFINKWGTQGTADGQLDNPKAISLDESENVYISDDLLNGFYGRVQKFTASGNFIAKVIDAGQFIRVNSIDMDKSDNLLIASYRKVQKFNSIGTFISSLEGGQIEFPSRVTSDKNGNIYIISGGSLQKYDSNGLLVKNFVGVHRDVAIDANGNIFSLGRNAANTSDEVKKLDSNGSQVASWGSYGDGNGQFINAKAIAVDISGNVYVADYSNQRVQKFSNSGSFISLWSTRESGDSWPQDLDVSETGKVFVADYTRLKRFSSIGTLETSWSGDVGVFQTYVGITGISIEKTGNVYITDPYNNRVRKFQGGPNTLGQWGTFGSGEGQFATPLDIAVDARGNGDVLVADAYNFRVQRFYTFKLLSTSLQAGAPGSQVILTGYNFDPNINNNVVKFNGTQATISSATSTSLTVTVPTGATTGKISVAKAGLVTYSADEFVVLPLTINSITPSDNSGSRIVTLTGSGFSTVAANNVVMFNGTIAEIISNTPTSIQVKIPANATTGKITVTVNGIKATSATDFVILPAAIKSANFPEFFDVGAQSTVSSILIQNPGGFVSAKFRYRGVTELANNFKEAIVEIPETGTVVSFNIPASYFSDPIGLRCEFVLTDLQGTEIKSARGYTYKKYPAGSQIHVIPDLAYGTTVDKYQLITIPLQLQNNLVTSVFKKLMPYNNKVWRLYSFENNENVEYPSFSSIVPGNGYWFISKNNETINPGIGNTVKVTEDAPFKRKLSAGWNLVGNPYNFTISWGDVLKHNKNPVGVGNMRQYLGGAFVDNNMLDRYRAGFVYSESSVELEIPIISRGGAGGRIESTIEPLPINNAEWQVNLIADDGVIRNELFGFGMHPQANESKDLWDEITLPIPRDLNSYEMQFRKVGQLILAKDIVETIENYSWDATINANNTLTLSWDNSAFGNNNKQLIIEKTGSVEVVDMRLNTQMMLPAGTHHLKIHFGDQVYVDQKIKDETIQFGEIFPNPVNQYSTKLSIWANLPYYTKTRITIYNSLGDRVYNSRPMEFESGRKILEWDCNFTDWAPGLYYVQIETRGNNSKKVFYKKLIIDF